MQEFFFTEKGRLKTHTCFVHYKIVTSVQSKGKLKEIYKDIFSGHEGLHVDCVIIGLLRNRP